MTKKITLLLSIYILCSSYGPPNCNLYKQQEACYQACKEAEMAIRYPQGSKRSQQYFDQSISHCPSFDYSHYEKAVPYAKRGLMKDWKEMIDEAVRLDPKEHLATRGWYHFFFMHNYEAAIQDLDALEQLVKYDIGYTGDGYYHLNIMKALCWKGLNQPQKAIALITQQVESANYSPGLYDYLHLAVLHLETGDIDAALHYLQLQVDANDVSEVYYYKALCMKQLNQPEAHQSNLEQALSYYDTENTMANPYRQLVDEIYRIDIEEEMNTGQ